MQFLNDVIYFHCHLFISAATPRPVRPVELLKYHLNLEKAKSCLVVQASGFSVFSVFIAVVVVSSYSTDSGGVVFVVGTSVSLCAILP